MPAFQAAYDTTSPPDRTLAGQARQRRAGAQGKLPSVADTLLFIVVYQTTHPLHTLHGWQCNVRHSPTNDGRHRLWPVRQQALRDRGQAPERDASRGATSPLALEGAPDVAIDGTERRRQRPPDASQHQEQYSGKTKTPTDKHLLLVNAHTDKVVSLGPTVAGTKHDKHTAEAAPIPSPTNATLAKDTGLQGSEPAGVLTQQPKKN